MDSRRLSISSEGTIIDQEQSFLLSDYPKSPINKTTLNQEQHSLLPSSHTSSSSSSSETTNQPIPYLTLPPLFTPPYRILRYHLTGARILTLILNIIAILIPSLNGFHSLIMIQVVVFQFTFVPIILLLAESISTSVTLSKILNPDPNPIPIPNKQTKRTSILVEDPETGEERWMLEPLPEEESVEEKIERILRFRIEILAADISLLVVMLGSIVFSAVFGRGNTGNLVGVCVVRGLMVVLFGGMAGVRWVLTRRMKGGE